MYGSGCWNSTDKYNKKLFQVSQGNVSPSKNKKHSVQTSFGKVDVKKRTFHES